MEEAPIRDVGELERSSRDGVDAEAPRDFEILVLGPAGRAIEGARVELGARRGAASGATVIERSDQGGVARFSPRRLERAAGGFGRQAFVGSVACQVDADGFLPWVGSAFVDLQRQEVVLAAAQVTEVPLVVEAGGLDHATARVYRGTLVQADRIRWTEEVGALGDRSFRPTMVTNGKTDVFAVLGLGGCATELTEGDLPSGLKLGGSACDATTVIVLDVDGVPARPSEMRCRYLWPSPFLGGRGWLEWAVATDDLAPSTQIPCLCAAAEFEVEVEGEGWGPVVKRFDAATSASEFVVVLPRLTEIDLQFVSETGQPLPVSVAFERWPRPVWYSKTDSNLAAWADADGEGWIRTLVEEESSLSLRVQSAPGFGNAGWRLMEFDSGGPRGKAVVLDGLRRYGVRLQGSQGVIGDVFQFRKLVAGDREDGFVTRVWNEVSLAAGRASFVLPLGEYEYRALGPSLDVGGVFVVERSGELVLEAGAPRAIEGTVDGGPFGSDVELIALSNNGSVLGSTRVRGDGRFVLRLSRNLPFDLCLQLDVGWLVPLKSRLNVSSGPVEESIALGQVALSSANGEAFVFVELQPIEFTGRDSPRRAPGWTGPAARLPETLVLHAGRWKARRLGGAREVGIWEAFDVVPNERVDVPLQLVANHAAILPLPTGFRWNGRVRLEGLTGHAAGFEVEHAVKSAQLAAVLPEGRFRVSWFDGDDDLRDVWFVDVPLPPSVPREH